MGEHHWDVGPEVAPDEETAGILGTADRYRYTDPAADEAWPRISGPGEVPDFPPFWGAEATERDQAAIDAGNA